MSPSSMTTIEYHSFLWYNSCTSSDLDNLTVTVFESQFVFGASVLIIKVCYPVVILAGLFGNTMIVIIQRRLQDVQDKSLSLMFTALAISDTVSLLFHPVFTVLESYGITLSISLDSLYKLRIWVLYWISWTSPWIIIAMAIQRAASIVWPHKVRLLVSRRKARTYVIALVLVFASSNSHILYGHSLRTREDEKTILSSYYYVSDDYRDFFDVIWSRVNVTMCVLIPFALLFLSNGVLIRTVNRSVKDMQINFGTGNSGVFRTRGKRVSSMTVRLISLSMTYLVLTAPVTVFFVLQETATSGEDEDSRALNQLVFAVCVLLWYSNLSCNFYVYCLSGRKYRQECSKVLHCWNKKKPIATAALMPGTCTEDKKSRILSLKKTNNHNSLMSHEDKQD